MKIVSGYISAGLVLRSRHINDPRFVTGTSTGIGFATALYLAKRGHTVGATIRSLAKAGPLEAAARDQGARLVSSPSQASIDRALAATQESEGAVDVLVNNAGIGGATPLELTPHAGPDEREAHQ